MKTNPAKFVGGMVLLYAMATASGQSTWNYFISDAGGGNSLVTWSVSGDLATAPGARWISSGPLLALPISAPGIFADAYLADGTPQSLPNPDGSYIYDTIGGRVIPISGYFTSNASGSSNDGFGLMVALSGTRMNDRLIYNPGTQSALIPVDYSDFNPGTYQSQISQFFPDVTVNLTVGVVPEPSMLALSALSGLCGSVVLRRRKKPFHPSRHRGAR